MNTSKYRFSLEVQESQSNVCLDVKRGDMKSRTLLITLTDGGFPYHISDECYAVFAATKPDGKKVFNDCVIEDDTIIYELTPQTTAAAGCAECEIRLYGADDKLLTSPGFLIAVHDTTFHDGDVVESETEMNALHIMISDAVEEYMEENDVGSGSDGLTVYTLAEGESIDDAPADADIIHDPYTEPEASGGGLVVYTLSEGETVDDAPADADIIHDPYEEPEIPEADISLNVEGASVGQIVKVAAVDEAGKPTAWEAVEMPRGGNEWVKLGDSTVHDTYEFIPTSFTGGVVTIDPNSEGYEYINDA